jgi:putative endonuclease
MNKRRVGRFFEDLACRYITECGGRIIERNYRALRGEIDVIAYDGRYLCFIEVKYRRDTTYGSPEAAVTISKQRQICKISKLYLYSRFKSLDIPIRYDVVAVCGQDDAVSVKWLKNAFTYR